MPVRNAYYREGTVFRHTFSLHSPISSSMLLEGTARSISVEGTNDMNSQIGSPTMAHGISRDISEGSPSPASMKLNNPGTRLKFRWVVKQGQRRIAVRVKQPSKMASMRPTMVLKANPEIGITEDIVTTAPESSDWTLIGPVILTITTPGVLWVEIWNNLLYSNDPLYIDHIVAT